MDGVMSLKMLFKNNRWLYRVWFHLNRKRINAGKIWLPSNSDHWYFDGYPRSGNTFYKNFFIAVHPEVKGASHLHCIAGLKIALKKHLSSIVIFRDPLESVSSYYYTKTHRLKGQYRMDDILLSELLNEWILYYSFVLQKYEIRIIHFSPDEMDVIQNVQIIEYHLGMPVSNQPSLHDALNRYQTSFNSGEGQKETAYSSLPKTERTNFKASVKAKLISLDRFEDSISIYNRLLERTSE